MPKLTKEQFNKFENVGSITLGDTIIISDPSYPLDTEYAAKLENVKPGQYNVFIHAETDPFCGDCILAQLIIHENTNFTEIFEELPDEISVDSGICGISDYNFFKNRIETNATKVFEKLNSNIENPDFIELYNYIINHTFDQKSKDQHANDYYNDPKISERYIQKYEKAALYDSAIFTFSGYGDGSYTANITRSDNQIDSILLNFGINEMLEEIEDDYFL